MSNEYSGSRGDAETRGEERVDYDRITGVVIDEAIKLHRDLGPGLLESVYEAILEKMLVRRGLKVERQKRVEFEYDGLRFDDGLRLDLLVEGRVVVELKSVEKLAPVHGKQVLTYLKLMDLPVGLLINFGGATLKEGLKRIVNNLPPGSSSLQVNLHSSPSESAPPPTPPTSNLRVSAPPREETNPGGDE